MNVPLLAAENLSTFTERQMWHFASPVFLQATANLPTATQYEPFTPRMSLDSRKVTATQDFAAALKEQLAEMMKQPVEERPLTFKLLENAGTSFKVTHFTKWNYNTNLQ